MTHREVAASALLVASRLPLTAAVDAFAVGRHFGSPDGMPHKGSRAIPENKAPDPLRAPAAQDGRPIDRTVEPSRDRGSRPQGDGI
jgi:hypothetical protein